MSPIAKRLQTFLTDKKVTIPQLQKLLGYSSPSKLYRLFDQEKDANPSVEMLEDFSNKFDELDIRWLLTGQRAKIDESYKDKYLSCIERCNELLEQVDGLRSAHKKSGAVPKLQSKP